MDAVEKRLQMLNAIKRKILQEEDLSWSNIIASVLRGNQLEELDALTNILFSLGMKNEVVPLLTAQYHLHVQQSLEQGAAAPKIKKKLGEVLWEVGQYSNGARILEECRLASVASVRVDDVVEEEVMCLNRALELHSRLAEKMEDEDEGLFRMAGETLSDSNEDDKAVECWMRAYALTSTKKGANHQDTLNILEKLADAAVANQRVDAERWCQMRMSTSRSRTSRIHQYQTEEG
jgi:hypothetical protein